MPPVPSDAAVALGAFLSHRGRHHADRGLPRHLDRQPARRRRASTSRPGAIGRRLFATPTGRRLLAPRSLAVIEREYLRFGVVGIFISRFLPGIRAVVPPFAGLVRTRPDAHPRARWALASAIWYGGITLLGALIGAEWERIITIIAGVNRTLGIVAAVRDRGRRGLVPGWRRRRRRRRSGSGTPPGTRSTPPLRRSSRAPRSRRDRPARPPRCWCWSWPTPTRCSRRRIGRWSPGTCATRWGLAAAEPLPEPAPEEERRTRFAGYADRLRQRFGRAQRLELVERMWSVAFSDGSHRRRTRTGSCTSPRSCSASAPPRWRSCAGGSGRSSGHDRRRRPRRGSIATSGSKGFRDFLALESGHSPNTVEAYLRDLRRLGEFALVARGARPRPRHPHRSCGTSSTCSRTSA